MTRLSLSLLGPFEALIDGQLLPDSRSKKIEALLIYLAVEHDRAHRRENLVGLLFPELPDDQARTNLRQSLKRLRVAIRDDEADSPYLLVTRETIRINPDSDYSLDTLEFIRLLSGCERHMDHRDGRCPNCMAQAQEAVALYRGPFVDGFFLEDSAAFDEWALGHRERFEHEALATLSQLAEYHERRGEYDQAVQIAYRQIEIEPWHEEAHRQIMRAKAYLGQRNSALQHYDSFQKQLRYDLGVDPMPETESLHQQITGISESRQCNLPHRNRFFVGRSKELAIISQYLADPDVRLLNLIGLGGSGKTALAIEAGWRVASLFIGPFMHGVYFIPMAGIVANGQSRADQLNALVSAVAESLSFTFSGPLDPPVQLLNYLQDKSILLILDNLEHIADVGRDFITSLFDQAKMSMVLVTSRLRLGLGDEWILEVTGLPYSDSETNTPDQVTSGSPAVELFMNRARHLSPDLEIGEDGPDHPCPQSSVLQICQLLQGLPLGIELAASWTRFLNCREITREIKNNLDFLADSRNDLPHRHHSLRAVFDYSWSLLEEQERQALAALSIFHGSFDRGAAGAICGASIQQLAALVDRSLLQHHASSQGAVARFELVEVIRHYAAEKLAVESGPNEIELNDKFARYYLGYLGAREEDLHTSRQQSALAEIDREMTNIRNAWRWASSHGEVSLLESALGALSLFYYMRSRFAEGETNFALAADKLAEFKPGNQVDIVWSRLVASQGWFAFLRGRQQEGQILLQNGIDQLRNYEEPSFLAASLGFLAVVTYSLGDYDRAVQMAREALDLSKSFGDRSGMIMGNNILSQINYLQGNFPEAHQFSEGALELERISDNRWSMGFSLTNLGRVAFAMADYSEAIIRFQEALEIRRELGDARGQAFSYLYLGDTEFAQGHNDEALGYFEKGRQIFLHIGSQSGIASALNRLSLVARRRGSVGEAWEKSIEALRLANQVQAIPGVLESLTILSSLLAAGRPELSKRIAMLVVHHPASTRRSSHEAKDFLSNLSASNDGEIDPQFSGEQFQIELNEVVANLLSEDQPSWFT